MSAATRPIVSVGVLASGVLGWTLGGYTGAGVGLGLGTVLLLAPWWRQPLWSWAALFFNRNRPMEPAEPSTVANDRSGGGVRYQDGIAVTAIQILGKRYEATTVTGSSAEQTLNSWDLRDLLTMMRHGLGLRLESMSVVAAGVRRRSSGDYPRVYDTLIGAQPYAGQRETWLIMRLDALANGDALRWRPTAGTAALAAAQRVAVMLRCRGIRARVATATDIAELDIRLGAGALERPNRRWHSLRGDLGWHTTYGYQAADITPAVLEQAWSIRADGIIQNVTLFADGSGSATVTVRTAQPPTAPPSVMLQTLPGEQAQAIAAGLCGPRPMIKGLSRGRLPESLVVPIGPSGVLFGRIVSGDRLLLPLGDPGEQTRIHIAAEDAIAKRIIIRAAASGDRVTVHSANVQRWESVRMPHVAVIEHPRPVPGTTVSVIDGTVSPAPRPNTVISVGCPGTPGGSGADIVVAQTGPHSMEVTAAGRRYEVEMEFFRAENRYVSGNSGALALDAQIGDAPIGDAPIMGGW